MDAPTLTALQSGVAIPAHPLALNARRQLDERRQRALTRYYLDAGVGGLAVAVHTTQFAIRDPQVGLFRPVLELAAEEMRRAAPGRTLVKIAGAIGPTRQAVGEAEAARDLGYDAVLLSLAALPQATDDQLVEHCKAVGEVLPVVGFYLQQAAGGRVLSYSFWRMLCEVQTVAAIKIAPFNRYRTLDVVRAVVESGRDDLALYTGNDDNIVLDLMTPFHFAKQGQSVGRRIVGGLLGHWSVWTHNAVQMLQRLKAAAASDAPIDPALLALNVAVTDANAAFFDAANGFAGCIAGLHEVLRRQGLLEGTWCLDPHETFGPGQRQEIDRVLKAYPQLNDDSFVRANMDRWLK